MYTIFIVKAVQLFATCIKAVRPHGARCTALFVLLFSVTVSANQQGEQTAADEAYEQALSLVSSQRYTVALQALRQINAQYPRFSRLASVQTRIAVLHEAKGAGNALTHYLSALDKRDSGDANAALNTLEFIVGQYPQSSLLDDALYLKAYMEAMDNYDFDASLLTLAQLETQFPDSAYSNSATYLRAINLEQTGESLKAISLLEALRDKHTALALPFGFRWPEGSVLSRYWYERADQRLTMLNATLTTASQLRSRQTNSDGSVRVVVSVDGVELALSLVASALTQETKWRDGLAIDRAPPSAAVYSGVVEGDAQSWVRAVLVGEKISGVAYAFGKQYQLSDGTLVGTIDYYKPGSAATRAVNIADGSSTEAELSLDTLTAPPVIGPQILRRASSSNSDIRVVPISVVIDNQYDQYYNGAGLAKVLTQINVADGIYRQFGVALRIDQVQIFGEQDANPMLAGPTTLELYLKDFRQYRLDQKTLFNESALTYLFTAKPATDAPLGLAWIDTLCRTDGYDVGITKPTNIGEVLFTHEVGHSLGAVHDTDTECNGESRKLMWPHISTQTERQFSDCSKRQLAGARAKLCLLDSVDLLVEASGDSTTLQVSVSNNDSSTSTDASVKIETSAVGLLQWPAGCLANSPTGALCTLTRIGPAETRILSIPVNAVNGASVATVDIEAEPLSTMDVVDSNNRIQYSMETQMTNEVEVVSGGDISDNATSEAATGASSGALSLREILMLTLLLLGAKFGFSLMQYWGERQTARHFLK